MTGLAESSRGRPHEHKRTRGRSCPFELAKECSRREERRDEVLAERPLEAGEIELPDRNVLLRVDARDRCAYVDGTERVARLGQQALGVGLDGEVGLHDRRAVELVSHHPRALFAAAVVDDDARSLGREGAGARGADPPGGAGDDDSLAGEAGLQ